MPGNNVDLGTLKVSLELKTGSFVTQVKNAEKVVRDSGRKMKENVAASERDIKAGFGKSSDSIMGFSKSVIGSIGKVTAAFGAISAAGFITKKVAGDIAALEAMDRTMRFATGSAQKAKETFAFLGVEAKRLGIDLEVSSKEFGGLAAATKGSSLEGEKTREIFLGVAEASKVLGLSSHSTRLVFKAFRDMISKGTIQAEELKRQLGDQLPGAVQIMARALGLGTSELTKMMEAGTLTTTDVLPKMIAMMRSEFAEEIALAGGSIQSAMNALGASFFNLRVAIKDSGVGKLLSGIFKSMAFGIDTIAKLVEKQEEDSSGILGMVDTYDKLTEALNTSNNAMSMSTETIEEDTAAIEANNLAVEEMVKSFDKKFEGLNKDLSMTMESSALANSLDKEELTINERYGSTLASLQSFYDKKLIVISGNSEKELAMSEYFEDLKARVIVTKDAALAALTEKANEQMLKEATTAFDERYGALIAVARSNFSGFADALTGDTFNIKDAFKNMVDSILDDLLRLALQQAVVDNLVKGFEAMLGSPSAGGSGGGAGAIIGGLLAGAKSVFGFAKGGIISEPVIGVGTKSGAGYTIGESGPEAVVPLSGNNGGGGEKQGNVVNVTINSLDSKSVTELMSRNPQAVTGPIAEALAGGDRGLSSALRESLA